MQFFNAEDIRENLGWKETIAALRQMFAKGCEAPVRHHHPMKHPGQQEATMLLMPAWLPGEYAGLKVVNVYPDNSKKGLSTIMGNYLLMDGATGMPLAVMDAGELTARRTVAASALAADYLSRKDARRLLIIGSGRLAGYLGFGHDAVRPLDEICLWARNLGKAEAVVRKYRKAGFKCRLAPQLKEAVGWADIVSCATMSTTPIVLGEWVKPGTHIDAIGAFKPTMRETDDALVSMASVFADTRDGVLAEAGDILIPMHNGTFKSTDIIAELSELTAKFHQGRKTEDEITLFKSVGASLEDLAAAIICYEKWRAKI